MSDNKKTYWKGLEELSEDPQFLKYAEKEFPEYLPVKTGKEVDDQGSSRRDFLKMMGFSLAAASLAACEAPVRKAIPYLIKPEEVDPGIPNYYASTYTSGGDYCSIVVKTREGRPIKIEGNWESKITQGGVNAQVEASVLTLYDRQRLRGPMAGGAEVEWETLDKNVLQQLRTVAASGGQISIVSNTVISPTTLKVIEDFKAQYANTVHITYDPQSAHGLIKANEMAFGKAVVPSYDFSKADVIVSFGADFLGTWISPIENTKQYSKTRKISSEKRTMSRHFQYESVLSLTGCNADYRFPIRPSQEGLLVVALYNAISQKGGNARINATNIEEASISQVADELWASRGKSLVVCGSNDPDVQLVVNAINHVLGNYGSTIDLNNPVNYRKGDEDLMNNFIQQAGSGSIGAVIFLGCNPVYDHPMGGELVNALGKIKVKIATNITLDETASLVDYVAPDHHYLESWNDAEPRPGSLSLAQPTISPLFSTRQAQSSLLVWSEGSETDYYTYLRENWRDNYYSQQTKYLDFTSFWDSGLYYGVYEYAVESEPAVDFNADLAAVGSNINKNYQADNQGLELVLYQKVGLGSGNQSNNPWLHEMPDPISKACWDNYLTIPQSMAAEFGIEFQEGATILVNVSVNGQQFKVPALPQPGQAKGTVGLALGYGRTKAGVVGNGVGYNAYPLMSVVNGTTSLSIMGGVEVTPTSEEYMIAQTQTHQTYMGRKTVIQESTLDEYKTNPGAGRYYPRVSTAEGFKKPTQISLWKGWEHPNHHWGMVIDMNSCTGCGTCTVACQVENNVAIVGKEEVLNRREMAWIRIDRYYSSPYNKKEHGFKLIELAADNPEVTFQPMMCQHCNNAPCETVCPVVATSHSSEGLNQMTYNRCIGTRYCANNCPYKVRRFNWFKYHDNDQFDKNSSMNNDLGKMVLNPDVVVRSRGVMEKCSLCVQRIQSGKLKAKLEGRRPEDKDVNTACAAACPADAIVFGDMKNPQSKISKVLKFKETEEEKVVGEERAYHVLEEINVRPNVYYLTKIRNKSKA